ncbi:MAG: aminotransferase class I/II-fold pyridoxal phosphate-dependent enzyme [Chloroflexi bacterium]|nr:aminotransferase class I/II-fold pyridoxal phosphate-dependent enzyme [Chloroflexota bacterium]MYA93888.1 aminotransferase class I/II-fold pyridoxal phosphate-dependent enzyme [Chloroflexota bacterium]MYD39437.1 aminotransferase class I/II-fold pyridoxal phosphate-dependent enzyme [Chloroflexota bacterium]MYE78004.1 aminotransferase class I/II-fold pyridoxal phosphate-dependent enzyme [Chloroflexota bacterium]MYH66901.1 aminotransferase class I/II-fold pyridoxal phosphate-dependent enzyme [C
MAVFFAPAGAAGIRASPSKSLSSLTTKIQSVQRFLLQRGTICCLASASAATVARKGIHNQEKHKLASQSKANILARHAANAALNIPLPAIAMRGARDLGADEPFYPLDERIIAGAADAMESGQTHYVDVPGIPPLREAIAEHLNADSGTSWGSANILVTAGMQEARFLTTQIIGAQYASIAVPAVAHPGLRKALGLKRREVLSLPDEPERGFLPTLEGIAAALENGCRLLYLESPSRLSGAVYSASQVARIADLLAQHDAAAIWDAGLARWVADGCSSLAAQAQESVAVIGEAWHGSGLGAWLVGAIAAPTDWIAPMQSQKQIMAICTSTASQYAALAASEIIGETQQQRLAQMHAQRAAAVVLAGELGLDILPGAAENLLALRLDASGRGKLAEAGIDFAAGEDFGAPDTIRLNIGAATIAALETLA